MVAPAAIGDALPMRSSLLVILVAAGCSSPPAGLDAGLDARSDEDASHGADAGPMDATTPLDARTPTDARFVEERAPDDSGIDAPSGPRCGDGALDAGEACDDGNATDGDGCSSACVIEGDCAAPLELEVVGTPIANGFTWHVDFTDRADVVTPSCQDAGLADVVLRFVPTRDGPIHARTRQGSAGLAVLSTCGGAELDCQADGLYSIRGLLDFDGQAGVPVLIVVSGRGAFGLPPSPVELDVREMPVRGAGEACDPLAIESLCAAGLACDGTCGATDLGCGAGVPAIDLGALWSSALVGHVTYAGSYRGAGDLGAVSCGAASSADVVHVVHLDHDARITSAGVINAGGSLSVRTACTSGEVGCSLTGVPSDHVFPAGSDVWLVVERRSSHGGDEYVLDVVREIILAAGETCAPSMGAPPGSACAEGLVCDATSGQCRATECGDGTPEGAEECDDGNLDPLDGCSPACALEDQGGGGDGCPGATLRLVPTPTGYAGYATGTTAGHDDDTDAATCGGVFMSPDVRYELSSPISGRMSITFGRIGSWDPALRLHAGACGGTLVSSPVITCRSSATTPFPWTLSASVSSGPHTITIDEGLGRTGGAYTLYVSVTP